jgi:phosphoglycolate phosphatase-like HAD superfamily hydrolase
MSKIKVFIDLDDTILDTQSFKRELFQIIRNSCPRIETEKITEHYQATKDKNGNPDLSEFAKQFEQECPDLNIISERFSELISSSKRFLIQERLDHLLDRFNRNNFEWILFTKGQRAFHAAKVKACDLEKFFDKIRYEESSKSDAINSLVLENEDFVVVEDRTDWLEQIGARHPNAKLYLFRPKDIEPVLYKLAI